MLYDGLERGRPGRLFLFVSIFFSNLRVSKSLSTVPATRTQIRSLYPEVPVWLLTGRAVKEEVLVSMVSPSPFLPPPYHRGGWLLLVRRRNRKLPVLPRSVSLVSSAPPSLPPWPQPAGKNPPEPGTSATGGRRRRRRGDIPAPSVGDGLAVPQRDDVPGAALPPGGLGVRVPQRFGRARPGPLQRREWRRAGSHVTRGEADRVILGQAAHTWPGVWLSVIFQGA